MQKKCFAVIILLFSTWGIGLLSCLTVTTPSLSKSFIAAAAVFIQLMLTSMYHLLFSIEANKEWKSTEESLYKSMRHQIIIAPFAMCCVLILQTQFFTFITPLTKLLIKMICYLLWVLTILFYKGKWLFLPAALAGDIAINMSLYSISKLCLH